jgi:hypothetical protein
MQLDAFNGVSGDDQTTVYLVKDDLGRNGAVWREADPETVISDLMAGEYKNPIRIVAFNSPSAGPNSPRYT